MTRRLSGRLGLYIGGEFLFSFAICFLFYLFIFLLNHLLLLAKQILAKGIALDSVLILLFYSLPNFLILSIPFATLTAALMAYGRFSSDNEILAMRSVGFNRFVIFRPVLILGTLLALLSFISNDILLPLGNRAFQRLWIELSVTHPGLELTEHSARKVQDAILVTGAIDKSGIHPLIIIERENSGNQRILMAKLAAADTMKETEKIPAFRLYDIFSLTPEKNNRQEWSWSTATSMSYRLLTEDTNPLVAREGPSTMRVSEVYDVVQERRGKLAKRTSDHSLEENVAAWALALNYRTATSVDIPVRQKMESDMNKLLNTLNKLRDHQPKDGLLQVWTLEYYQKFAIPFACIPFVILAFPLGLTTRRSGRAAGFFIGLLLAAFYWSLLIIGRSLGLRSNASPFVVMVLPDIILLIIGILLFLRRSRI